MFVSLLDAASSASDSLLEKRDWSQYRPHEITHGNCYEWALDEVSERGGTVMDVDLWPLRGHCNLPYHVWVQREGKAIDAESPEGVGNWRELKYFQEHSNRMVMGMLRAREMPPPPGTLV